MFSSGEINRLALPGNLKLKIDKRLYFGGFDLDNNQNNNNKVGDF